MRRKRQCSLGASLARYFGQLERQNLPGRFSILMAFRRALGATKRHVAVQFLSEALLLAVTGGIGGVILGSAVTAAYASIRGWGILIPQVALIGGFAAALVIGAVAGLYPAIRAARLSPTEALRTT